MSNVTIITNRGDLVYVDGNVSVHEGTGVLQVHDSGYTLVARFERGYWAGYTVATAIPKLAAPAPASTDDCPF